MIERKDIGSWLEGPPGAPDQAYPGQALGLPREGRGAVARFPRRLLGLTIDWILVSVIAMATTSYRPGATGAVTWVPLGLLLIMNILLVGTLGTTIGHRLVGVDVVRIGGGYAGPLLAIARSILLCLALPPLIMDRDQRGLHDRLCGTYVRRT